MQLGNACGGYLMQSVGLLFDGMTDILTEAMSKRRIEAAGCKELINGWTKLYSSIITHCGREKPRFFPPAMGYNTGIQK